MFTSPSGKSYIGQTTRPIEKRFQQHQKRSTNCVAIHRAIQKYGWENFEKDWYECPDEDLNFDEELLIREMGTMTPEGYNLKTGGGNGKMSNETKQKMSDGHRGEKSYMFGIPKGEESKRKISDSTKGEKNHKSKRVYQYDLDGTFIGSFGSTREAGRYYLKDGSHIRTCARGKSRNKSAYGFKWSYVRM